MGFLDAILGRESPQTVVEKEPQPASPEAEPAKVDINSLLNLSGQDSATATVKAAATVIPDPSVLKGINPPDAQENKAPEPETEPKTAPLPTVGKPRSKMTKPELLDALNATDELILALTAQIDTLAAARIDGETSVNQEVAQDGFVVYLSCVPTNQAARHLHEILAPLEQAARLRSVRLKLTQDATDKGDDYAHYLLTPFSRGPALVAALLLKEIPKLSGPIFVDPFHPSAGACLSVLLASDRCLDVVRPIR